ncbi:helix-turn-helix domain-containing protein [bacterium]|nr:helix-turn-helix domain-containing protein [bacterium]
MTEPTKTTSRVKVMDKLIGQRIKQWRISHGYSQKQLAEVIGITYQQLHKYEGGVNRISAGTLADLCQKLNIPISYMFEGILPVSLQEGNYQERSAMLMMREYMAIPDPSKRELVCQLVRTLAQSPAMTYSSGEDVAATVPPAKKEEEVA